MNRYVWMFLVVIVAAAVAPTAPAHAQDGFIVAGILCPDGKVAIGGGGQVTEEGSADFQTVIQETAPGTADLTRSLWVTAMKNNDAKPHTVGIYAICADATLAGYQVARRVVTVAAHGFMRETVGCPADAVVLGGGAVVEGDGARDHHTVLRESAPGDSPWASQWLVALSNNDSQQHTVGIYAVCVSPKPSGYWIVRKDHYMVAGDFWRGPTPCLQTTVIVGGGMAVVNAGHADFGTTIQETAPGVIPVSSSWTMAMRNGPAGYDLATYAVCMDMPPGYEILRKEFTI